MKKGFIIIFIFVSLFIMISEEKIADWQCYKSIELGGSNKYKYFFLDKEIYLYSNTNLSDLRIIDKLGSSVPYYILEGFKEEEKEEIIHELKLIKNSKETNKEKTLTNTVFDYQLLSEDKNLSCNKLEFDVDNSGEYSNQIEVYGRNEKSNWSFITKDTIYNIDKFKKNDVSLSNFFNYSFYRIKIIDSGEKALIKECRAVFKRISNKYDNYKETTDLKFDALEEEKTTLIKIENSNKLKLLNIDIIAEGNFNRKYDLTFGNSDYSLYSDNLYKFNHNNIDISKTMIVFSGTWKNDTALALRIFNNDNAPLKIDKIGAEYIIDKVIFEDNESKEYKLYFGNPDAEKPSYDIVTFQSYIEKDDKDKCSLGSLVKLKESKEEKESKINYKLIFNILIVVVSIALVSTLVLILRKK